MAYFDGPFEFDFEAELQELLGNEGPDMPSGMGLPGAGPPQDLDLDLVDNIWLDMCFPTDTRPLPANSDSCRQPDAESNQMKHNIPELKVSYAPPSTLSLT